MITLIIGLTESLTFETVLGIILTCLEVIIVVIKLLQMVLPAESKMGRFLRKILPGLEIASKVVHDMRDNMHSNDNSEDTEDEHNENSN